MQKYYIYANAQKSRLAFTNAKTWPSKRDKTSANVYVNLPVTTKESKINSYWMLLDTSEVFPMFLSVYSSHFRHLVGILYPMYIACKYADTKFFMTLYISPTSTTSQAKKKWQIERNQSFPIHLKTSY